ncbi:hypothetical protein EMIT0357P_40274 [Pseudomonas marginalis]|nr:hypothetical protein SAMN04490193_4303 [Pseudomonas marginalis]
MSGALAHRQSEHADGAPSHIAGDTVAKGTVLTHLPLRGQRRNRGSTVYKCARSPASLFHSVDPWVTEHLEQAAKVSGLGVERQLKLALHLNHRTSALLYPYRYQGEHHA